MDLPSLIQHYGYWVVFAGAVAEGESVLMLAGFAAHRGLLELPMVIGLAAGAAVLGDQVGFYIGQRHGARLMKRFPAVARQAERVQPLLKRYPYAMLFGVRFVYGMRTVGPVALGALGVSRWRFAVMNLLSAAVWAVGFTLLGYQFGHTLQWLLDDVKAVEEGLLAAMLAAALVWAVYRRRH